MSSLNYAIPTHEQIIAASLEKFKVSPCVFQVESTLAQLRRQKDVFTIAPTGAGKTLCFWLPLLFNAEGIIIIVTALNQLGDKMVDELKEFGYEAVNVTKTNATKATFQVLAFRNVRR